MRPERTAIVLLQASAEVPNYKDFKAAWEWLAGDVEEPDGFISMHIMQAHDNPNHVTMMERWASVEAFEAAYATYDMEQRAEFLSRAGINPETFDRTLWVDSDIEATLTGTGT